jgi:hypothetical protein
VSHEVTIPAGDRMVRGFPGYMPIHLTHETFDTGIVRASARGVAIRLLSVASRRSTAQALTTTGAACARSTSSLTTDGETPLAGRRLGWHPRPDEPATTQTTNITPGQRSTVLTASDLSRK